jgi:hypothetical protein
MRRVSIQDKLNQHQVQKTAWKDVNHGPYCIFRIVIRNENPFKDLADFVYHDGTVMLSEPGQIDLLVSKSRSDDFIKIARERGYLNICVYREIEAHEETHSIFVE